MDLAVQIDCWLLAQPGWVSAAEICTRWECDERDLRGTKGTPGLLSEIAISHTKHGYRHIECATLSEWIRFKCQQKRHAINELRRVRALAVRRANVIRRPRGAAFKCEADTGQYLLPV